MLSTTTNIFIKTSLKNHFSKTYFDHCGPHTSLIK